METRSNRFLVFAVVGILLLTLLAFAFWLFSASNPDGRDYLIRFKGGVAGVEKGSPVTFSGVPAGSVTSVRLAQDDPSTALVKVRVDPEFPVLRGVRAAISRSLMGGGATVALDGAEKGAPPIERLSGQALPEIPAKKGGLLGSGGDPMAFIEKISRSVDNVSANLDPRGQDRLRKRLAALDERSANWPDDAARMSDSLTGAQGKISRVGGSIANVGQGAERLGARLEGQRGTALRSVNEGLRGVRRGAQSFVADVRDARPAIAAAEKKRRAITKQVQSARLNARGIADRAQQIDRSGLQFGSPKLPDHKRKKGPAKPPSDPPPSQ
jgi:phospholipid/cholesterol/gamma-HCH transport system substrate-binding protein